MAIAHPVASVANSLGGTGTAITAAFTPGQVGDLICVAGIVDGLAGVTFTISDTATNTWTTANPVFTGSGTNRAQSWYAFANGTSSTTITVTASGTVTFRIILVDDFRGTASDSSVLGPHNETSGSGTPTSGSIALTSNECVVWSFCADTVTAVGLIDGTNGTKGADDAGGDWSEYRVLTGRSGNSITAAFAGSGAYTIGTVAFHAPSAVQPDVLLRPRTKMGFRDSRGLQGPGFKVFG